MNCPYFPLSLPYKVLLLLIQQCEVLFLAEVKAMLFEPFISEHFSGAAVQCNSPAADYIFVFPGDLVPKPKGICLGPATHILDYVVIRVLEYERNNPNVFI
jgi:hypothetical protein